MSDEKIEKLHSTALRHLELLERHEMTGPVEAAFFRQCPLEKFSKEDLIRIITVLACRYMERDTSSQWQNFKKWVKDTFTIKKG